MFTFLLIQSVNLHFHCIPWKLYDFICFKDFFLFFSIKQELASADFSPPDLVTQKTVAKRRARYHRLALTVIGASSFAFLVWKKDFVIENATSLVRRVHLLVQKNLQWFPVRFQVWFVILIAIVFELLVQCHQIYCLLPWSSSSWLWCWGSP